MPDQDAHHHKLLALLPRGTPWEGADVVSLARALAGDPARVDAAAEQLLEDFMPDTCGVTGAFIDDWARLLGLPEVCESDAWQTYTDAQKQAAIIAKLRFQGLVNQPELELTFQAKAGSEDAQLYHHVTPPPTAGAGYAGGPLYGPQWAATWFFEYMPDILDGFPDDFAAWTPTTDAAANNNEHSSPATMAVTAAEVVYSDVNEHIAQDLNPVNPLDHNVQFDVWIKAISSGEPSIAIQYERRDGTTTDSIIYQLTDTWVRIVHVENIGAGDEQARVRIIGSNCTIAVSWAIAGSRDDGLECAVSHLPPINTTGVYEVIGALFGGLGGDELVDDLDDELLVDDLDSEVLTDD